jgi:hypothetical protein
VPTRVNGVDQMPMAGVSMLYTLDDAEAPDRHTTQYFELTGTRAIYHEGWWAGTRHGQDGLSASAGTVPFDEDVWELHDMTTDFGHANDLAAEHPEKLAELQAIFDREARKYNVYPLADNVLALLSAERPGLVSGNKGRERYTITSVEPLPNGPCTIRFDFAYDGGGAGKGGTGSSPAP